MKSAAVLLPLLGVSWAFGLLTINKKTIAFQYIFAISNSFQVIIIIIFNVFHADRPFAVLFEIHAQERLLKSIRARGAMGKILNYY